MFAHLVERQRPPICVVKQVRGSVLQMFGQVTDIDKVACCGYARSGDYIFQFTDIPGPGMLQKNGLGPSSEPGNIFSVGIVVLLEKKLDQQGYVFETLGKRR